MHAAPAPEPAERTPRWTVRRSLLSLGVATLGLIDLGSALFSHPLERLVPLRHLVPTSVIDSSRTFTLLAGMLLLVTAWGLRHGKRRAYVAALLLAAVSVPFNLLKAVDLEEATVAAAMMFLLGVNAEAFRVKSRELTFGAVRRRTVIVALALAAYAVAGCWILELRYAPDASLGRALAEAAYRLFGVGSPSLSIPTDLPVRAARIVAWFLDSLGLLGFTLLLGVAVAALRPALHRSRHRAERDRVAALVAAHGDSSVAWFALAPDADYFFSNSRRAVIAYRFESDVLLAIGDPIGPEEERRPLLRDFARYAEESDWTIAFFQSRPEYAEAYRALGWRSLHIGEDPVLHLDTFSLEGSAMGDVRRSARRLSEAGWKVRHYRPGRNPFDPAADTEAVAAQLAAISAEWLKAHAEGERGFCMGRFDPRHFGDVWLAVAWNAPAARAEAFVTWVPIPARRGWALDLMRRRHDAAPGAMEIVIASSAAEARSEGDALLSLSLSALARADQDPDLPAQADSARAFLARHLARFYGFEGLFRWKSKFGPTFEPRHLVYTHPLALPRVAVALARAQSAGGLRSYLRRAPRPQNLGTKPPGPV